MPPLAPVLALTRRVVTFLQTFLFEVVDPRLCLWFGAFKVWFLVGGSNGKAQVIEQEIVTEQWKVTKLKPYKRNAKLHPPEQVAFLAKLITAHGFDQPIVVDKKGVIVKGHGRWLAAQKLGLDAVPVIVRDLTAAQAAAARIADNRVAEFGWDTAALVADVSAAMQQGLDVDLIGFSLEDLGLKIADGELFVDGAASTEAPVRIPIVEDEIPLPAKKAFSRVGQVWQLGRHVLVCGDSTDVNTVSSGMQNRLADLVFTDPPWGVDYSGGANNEREKLIGDKTTELYAPACAMSRRFSADTAALYLWHAGSKLHAVSQAVIDAQYDIRCVIIWNKNQAQMGAWSAQYKAKHEPALYCYKRGYAPKWYGPNNEVTVWDIDRSAKNEFHPTQKPVALAARALQNSSAPNDLVLDLFGGSGSTLIAAEQLDRSAVLFELEPLYVDVIIERWQNLTGSKAELVA